MTDWRSSDDPNRSESERRQDAMAWELIAESVERGGWHQVDRAVAKAVPKAREKGLLDAPWKVYVIPSSDDGRPYVTIEPSGGWEFGSEGPGGETTLFASSDRPGVSQAPSFLVFALRVALKRELKD